MPCGFIPYGRENFSNVSYLIIFGYILTNIAGKSRTTHRRKAFSGHCEEIFLG
jgi:hypothetical protein